MGTRADFYIGRGEAAEWLGSIAWDGYPSGIAGHVHGTASGDTKRSPILTATSDSDFRAAVAKELARREDGTTPDHGWPWPWENSRTTDFAYAFDGGAVWASCFGGAWFDPVTDEPGDGDPVAVFPDMSSRQAVTLGKRSGVIVVGTSGPVDDLP